MKLGMLLFIVVIFLLTGCKEDTEKVPADEPYDPPSERDYDDDNIGPSNPRDYEPGDPPLPT